MKINSRQPITTPKGLMTDVFRTWMLKVSNNLPIIGTGSPDGSVEAPQYSLYIDETTPATPVEWRKMLPEVGGDRTKGWYQT